MTIRTNGEEIVMMRSRGTWTVSMSKPRKYSAPSESRYDW